MDWQTFLVIVVTTLVVRIATHYGFDWIKTKRMATWECPQCQFVIRSNRVTVVNRVRETHLDSFHEV